MEKTPLFLLCLIGSLFLFFVVFTDTKDVTNIHAIQGSGAVSPEEGKIHTIEGVVTAGFQGNNELQGFFVQEEDSDVDVDPMTSEGIFVYAPNGYDVTPGNRVRITGEVREFHGSTQMQNIRNITITAATISLPAAIRVSLPFANESFPERYESMLVTFPQTLTVIGMYYLGKYGQIDLSSGGRLMIPTQVTMPGTTANALQAANTLRRILLDDGSRAKDPDPVIYPSPGLSASNTLRIGDTVADLTGVIHYSFNYYRLHPTVNPEFAAINVRPAKPPAVGGSLKVAGFNLFNYFTTIDNGRNGARGADSEREFIRQRKKLLSAIVALDADILGIMELENNETGAIRDLVNGLNDAAGAGTYAYIPTGKMGEDQIRVALIYQPASITPAGTYLTDLHRVFERPPLGQVFEDSLGERFSVVVSHFKSKRCKDASGADIDQEDGQGCYNETRTRQAAQLLAFITTEVIPGSGDPDVLILGDINAYANEDPLTSIEGAGYTNLLTRFTGVDAYSYVFSGQSGYLTHALASSSLADQVTGAAEWHINADEPRILDYNQENKSAKQLVHLYNTGPYRSSDHDPLLIGLHLWKR